MRNFYTWSILCFLSCFANTSQGRLHFKDADSVDADANIGVEYYNDIISYQWPSYWDRIWDHSLAGYRVSAGSLTMTRFYFKEDLKLDPMPLAPWSFSFYRSSLEDFSQKEQSSEARLGVRLAPFLRIFALGDTGADKEYGDLGAGIRLFESKYSRHDIFYWSVDHYYNEKTHEENSKRLSPTRSWILNSYSADPQDSFGWNLRIEVDPKVEWIRSNQTLYQYERRKILLTISDQEFLGKRAKVETEVDQKSESFTTISDDTKQLAFHRDRKLLKISFADKTTEEDELLANEWIFQMAQNTSTWNDTRNEGPYQEGKDPWSIRPFPKRLYLIDGNFTWLRGERLTPSMVFRWGFVNDRVYLHEDEGRRHELESKLVSAIYIYGKEKSVQNSFALNATWDLDQIASDYPYRSRPFRPWGGGNIQAHISF